MKLALDTNCYVEFCRGEPKATERVAAAEKIFLPLIVLGELRAGFNGGNRALQNERILSRVLNSPRVRVLLPDEQTTFHYAKLFAHLRKRGTPIPTNDLWIAALVVQHDLILFSRDAHFDNIPQLNRVP